MSARPDESERPVAPLELLFDLVFVFGFTQVTTLLTRHPTWAGLGHALLILTALWWAWAAFAWLTNVVDPEEGKLLGAMLAAMAATFVAALAVPGAFGDDGDVFGVAFLLVNAMYCTLYALAARGDIDLLGAIVRTAPWVLVGSVLILIAGFVDGWLRPALWVVALAVGFIGPGLLDVHGFRVEPAHFAERHGLIVIIAIGEALIAVGVGARALPLDAGVIVAALLGFFVAVSFWLAYFDFFAIRGRQLLAGRSGEDRVAIARDVYTYLHLPMVAGIILFAFGVKETLEHLGHTLGTVEALALCGGAALYLLAYVALRARVTRSLGHGRPVAALACAVLIPVARAVPALAALALVACVLAALHTYELIRWRESRAQARMQRFAAPS